jgi:DNA-binding response OmpR family regulator
MGSAARVLVVDDEPSCARFSPATSRDGFEVEVAGDGEAALIEPAPSVMPLLRELDNDPT